MVPRCSHHARSPRRTIDERRLRGIVVSVGMLLIAVLLIAIAKFLQ
jgi:hypothetical protein